MSFIVKITTTMSVMDWLAPHSCMGCGALGRVLCACCKKDIETEHQNCCPICQQPILRGVCTECRLPFEGVYMCGWRDELMGRMVETYKYQSRRALAAVLAGLMEAALPEIAGEVIVVPLPTIDRHIRERGFDHTALVAKKLAKLRGWKMEKMLVRKRNTVQVGASAKKRIRQAGQAYGLVGEVSPEKTYILLDDVWTTGASMKAAEKLLREAGAERVIGAISAVSRRS